MAIIQSPVAGKPSGSFGNAVFVTRGGKTFLRSKPFNFQDAKTPEQLSRRNNFRLLVRLIHQVVPVINMAYAGTLAPRVPFNYILSLNMKNAFTGDPPVLDHAKVVFCDHEGGSIQNVVITRSGKKEVHVEWDPGTDNRIDLAAMVGFIAVNISTLEVVVVKLAGIRAAGVSDFTLPAGWNKAAIALHCITTESRKGKYGGPLTIIRFAGYGES